MAILTIFVLALVCILNTAMACPAQGRKTSDNDRQRVAKSYPLFIEGVKNIVNSSDPLSVDVIPGNLPDVKYELKNIKMVGLKNCVVTALNINKKQSKFKYNLECPHFETNADYYMLGYVNGEYVDGEGHFTVKCDAYIFKFNGNFEIYTGKDGKNHGRIKNYFLDVDAGKVNFNFQNIYGADKVKGDKFNKFVNDNWLSIDKTLRAPALNGIMDVFIANLNDFFGVVPVEEVFPDQYLKSSGC